MPPRILNLGTGRMLLASLSTCWIRRPVGPQSRSRRCWEKEDLSTFEHETLQSSGPQAKSAAAGSCRAEVGRRDCQGGIWGFHKDTVEDQESGMFECGSRVAGFAFPDVSNECIVFIVMSWEVQDPGTWHHIREDLAPPQGTPVCARTRNKTWGTTASRLRINIQCTTIVCGTVDPLYSRLRWTWPMNLLQQRQPSHAPSRPRFKAIIRREDWLRMRYKIEDRLWYRQVKLVSECWQRVFQGTTL